MATAASSLILVEMERNLYRLIAMTLLKDPHMSLMVMALWSWLEIIGFDGLIKGIMALPVSHTDRIADEGIMYINYLGTHACSSSSQYIELPLTLMLLGEGKLASNFFFRNRDSALSGILDTIENVRTNVLDLLEQVTQRNISRSLVDSQINSSTVVRPEGSSRTNTNIHGTNIARGNLQPDSQRHIARSLVDSQINVSTLIRPERSSRTNTDIHGTNIDRGNLQPDSQRHIARSLVDRQINVSTLIRPERSPGTNTDIHGTNIARGNLQPDSQRHIARSLVDSRINVSTLIRPDRFSRTNTDIHGTNIARGNLQSDTVSRVVGPYGRSLFATFSRGHPLSENEIYEFLNSIYGDCVETIYMEDKPVPLCAVIVFYSLDVMYDVLNGVELAKYMVNGKHIWLRKYVPKPEYRVQPPS